MNKNNCFTNTNFCSGCGACYAICPVSAVSYALNDKGFYEAQVDEDKCIACGKCIEVCPKYIEKEKQIDKNNFPVYSFVHKNPSILAESTSGAAAWALTEIAIKNGYTIVGVEYNYTSNIAKTNCANNLTQAKQFKGSKYIQADTKIYRELLKKPGKFIVFGTPCQIAGLTQTVELQHRKDDFLMIDCFCHGVPSYHIWHKFLQHIDITNPTQVSFRSKKGGWHNFLMEIKDINKNYCANAQTNPFYELFFSGLLLNNSCYTCKVKSAMYCDIRMGDFWGSYCDLNETGVSLLIPMSSKGNLWLKQLSDYGLLSQLNFLCSQVKNNQSSFSEKKSTVSQRDELLTYFATHSFEQGFNLYKMQLSKKKSLLIFIKSLCPQSVAKYIRFFIHKLKGL